MGTITIRASFCAVFLLLCCVNHIAAVYEQQRQTEQQHQQPQPGPSPTFTPPQQQQQQNWRLNGRGSQRHQTTAVSFAQQHSEIKDVMKNLHDRVSVLATLDEDQRNRLEVIDKKIDGLVESNAGRMESLKAQQLDFAQKLSSLEHIQRLSRSTLDELKGERDAVFGPRAVRQLKYKRKNRARLPELSRQQRQAPQGGEQPAPPPYVTANMASVFGLNSSESSNEPDVPTRLDALAMLLTTISYRVHDTQQALAQLSKTTNNIRSRLVAQGKRQQALQATSSRAQPALPQEDAGKSCLDSHLAVNGILKLQLGPESEPFYVPCEEAGWTVILNRSSDDLSFERNWQDYKEGFGNLAGDFFIGLDKLNALTSSTVHELRIVLENFKGDVAYAGYDAFAISGERELYTLNLLGRFQDELLPSAGDSLRYQAGAKFSTFDKDNDNCGDCNCAQRLRGGGWFNACSRTNLMGVYHAERPEQAGETGIYWDSFQGVNYSLRSVKMLIRPVGQLQDEARR